MKTHQWRQFCMAIFCGTILLIGSKAFAKETERGTVIYEANGLEVVAPAWQSDGGAKPALSQYCSAENKTNPGYYPIFVYYTVAHKEREQFFRPSYERFVQTTIYPSLISVCGQVSVTDIDLSMYKMGETGGRWDVISFKLSDSGHTIQRSAYHPSKRAQASMSMEEIAAHMPQQSASISTQPKGTAIYSDGKIKIYAREEVWCASKDLKHQPTPTAGLDIIVPVPYNELQGWLRKHYGRFELSVIKPLAEKSCFPSGGFNAKFYQEGQSAFLEDVRYGWQKSRNTMQRQQFAVLSRHAGQTRDARLAVVQKEKERQDAWGIPCNGYFCALPGGAYFQAILAGDINAVKHMDTMADAHAKEWVRKKLGSSIANRKKQHYSLLPVIADTYFFNYQSDFMLGCHEDGLVTKSYSFTDDMYETPDFGDLAMPDMGGETVTTTYVLRPEFVQLCDKVCDAFGGKFDRNFVKATNMSAARETLNGVYEMPELYQCSSDAVRLFEKNLIKLTEEYLSNKKNWLTKTSGQAFQRQVMPKAVNNHSEKPFRTEQKDIAAPSVQPASINTRSTSNANATAIPQARQTQSVTDPAKTKKPMSDAERYEQMNAEIAALSETYTARLNDLSQEFKKNMRNISDTVRKTEMLREFQAKMAKLNAEAARETQKVKNKYKEI